MGYALKDEQFYASLYILKHGIDGFNTLSSLEMIIDIILFLWRILASYFSVVIHKLKYVFSVK